MRRAGARRQRNAPKYEIKPAAGGKSLVWEIVPATIRRGPTAPRADGVSAPTRRGAGGANHTAEATQEEQIKRFNPVPT